MVLDFTVGSVAKRDLVTIDENSSVLDAAKLMAQRGLGSVVVTRGEERIGILTERDMLKKVVAASLDARSTKVKQVMTSPPVTIEHDRTLREAIDLMNRKRIRRMLVTENGKIVGVFTQRDILAYTRICLNCGKEIKSVLDGAEPEAYMECTCGSRYHKRCAETVVNCVSCSRALVFDVVYPEPSETFSG